MTTSDAFKYATQCPVFARPSLLSQACVSQHVLSLLQVQGKVNAITLDSCTRTGLVFQDLVSSCEVVNCISVEVQSTGIMPTIAIDKTDGIAVRLELMACSLHAVCKAGVFDASKTNIDTHIGAFPVGSSRRSSVVMCCSVMQLTRLVSARVVAIF